MRYYLIKEDKKYTYAPQIIDWYSSVNIPELRMGLYDSMPNRMLLRIRENPNTVFTDVLIHPLFLVSKSIKECLKLYEPNMTFKEVILLDKINRKTKEYFMPVLSRIRCPEHNGNPQLKIDLSLARDKSIFELYFKDNLYIAARLDAVESILRRGSMGFVLREVACT